MREKVDEEIERILIAVVTEPVNDDNNDALLKLLHFNARANNGIYYGHFVPLVKLALSQKLSGKQSNFILKCLKSRTFVPWKAVIIAISHLCTNQLPEYIQTKVARWIFNIFDDIDDTEPLHSLYDILFHFLGTESVDIYIAQILSKLTKKTDVKLYRIKKLKQLWDKTNSSHLSTLLHCYMTLCPDGVQTNIESKNYESMPCHGPDSIYARLKPENQFMFPSPPLVMLKNPHALFDLCIQYKLEIPLRLDTWLKFYLAQSADSSKLDCALSDLSDFQEHIQEGIPASRIFLKRFLNTFNFNDNLTPIFELVSWVPICPINELYETFLEPLIKMCFNLPFKRHLVSIIHTLTNLLQNFAFVEMNKRNSTHINIFSNGNKENEPPSLDILVTFINYMNELHVELVKVSSDLPILYAIISFYELISDLHLKYDLPIIELPPLPIIEICLLSCNAFTIARLCALICRYKFAFKSLKQQLGNGDKSDSGILNRSLDHIRAFNTRLLLMCDILFRNRAFKHTKVSFYLPLETLNNLSIDRKYEKLNLFHHSALIGHAFQFLEDTQNDNKIEVLRCIFAKPHLRTHYFEFLKKWNLFGIVDFFNEFIPRKLE